MMDYGIFNRKGKADAIPLKGVRISGDICGLHGELSVEQLYVNEENEDLEIIYTFPMPDRAAISEFSARVGDRIVRSEIREKEEAFNLYDQWLRKGDSAFLLEQFRPNIFQVSLGRVLPGEEVKIKIVYLETISYQDGEMRISIPTLVAPRYIPGSRVQGRKGTGWSDPTGRVPDADFITPPVDGEAAYRVELKLNLKPLIPVDEFISPSHMLHVTGRKDGSTQITLAKGAVPLDRDIVILGRCRDESAAAVLSWEDPDRGKGYLYLHLLPHLDAGYEQERLNYIFLIDISGSMQGAKLEQAKNALQLCLRNMEAGDSFNIVAFESGCHYLFPAGNVPFNQGSLDRASIWINNLVPRGGTEIMEPVKYALESSGKEGTAILLFTDGQVGNEQEIIDLVRSRIRGNRLFTFGIDTAVNSYFINSLAEAGRGLPEFIHPGERIEDKVIRQFYRINSPAVSNAAVRWSAMPDMEFYPRDLPPLFDREPVTLVGKYSGSLSGTATLEGDLKKGNFKVELDLNPPGAGGGSGFLKKLWAKMKIEYLEKTLEGINPRRSEAVVEEIVKLSREYGVGSSRTSFVAVHERMDGTTGIPQTVVVPVAPAAEWRMFSSSRRSFSSAPAALSAPSSRGLLLFQDSRDMLPSCTEMLSSNGEKAGWSRGSDLRQALRLIAMRQNAEGSFPAESGAENAGASIFENTAMAALALLLAAHDGGIYRRQIEKSVNYLMDERRHKGLKELQLFAAALAGRLYLEKMRPEEETRVFMNTRVEAMRDKAGSPGAILLREEIPEKEILEKLADLLGGRKGGLQELTPESGIKTLAAAIFGALLQMDA